MGVIAEGIEPYGDVRAADSGERSGLPYTVPCLQSHVPGDVVVISLGRTTSGSSTTHASPATFGRRVEIARRCGATQVLAVSPRGFAGHDLERLFRGELDYEVLVAPATGLITPISAVRYSRSNPPGIANVVLTTQLSTRTGNEPGQLLVRQVRATITSELGEHDREFAAGQEIVCPGVARHHRRPTPDRLASNARLVAYQEVDWLRLTPLREC